jgi:hypothetical protein
LRAVKLALMTGLKVLTPLAFVILHTLPESAHAFPRLEELPFL